MATIKNSLVLGALMALNDLAGKDFAVKTALKIRTMHKDISGKWEIVEEVRKSLIDKFAERDEKGNPVAGEPQNGQETVKIAEENREAFNAAWKELLDQDIEVSGTLVADDFGDVKVAPGTLLALGDLVVG